MMKNPASLPERRVVVNGRFLTRPTTGVERVAHEMLRALAERLDDSGRLRSSAGDIHFEVLVPPTAEPVDFPGIPTRPVGSASGHRWEQTSLLVASRGCLLVNLCNTGPVLKRSQVVYLHDAAVFVRGEGFTRAFRWWYRAMHLAFGRWSKGILTNTETSRVDLAHHLRIDAGRISVAALGSQHALRVTPDESVVDRLGLETDRFVLAVGSHNPNKNLAGLSQAARLLSRSPGAPPVVAVGRVNPRVFETERGEQLDSLHLVGPVNDEELVGLYRKATCLVFPSFHEGFGLPPLEAMAHGCPVVASRIPSLEEVCGDAVEYCDPADPGSIAAAIASLLASPHRRSELAAAGRTRAAEFDWNRTVDVMLSVIDRVLPPSAGTVPRS